MKKERLSKVLARAGVASRRKAEALIFEGKIQVNGSVCTLPQTLVCQKEDRLTVEGKPLKPSPRFLYILLNKPKGYVCSCSKKQHKKIILDLFPDITTRIFPVGRLDKATTGLLLLTNDGHFAHEIIHPRSNIEKEYLAATDNFIEANHLKKIAAGTTIEKQKIVPVKVEKVRRNKVKITVKEGKKHEVRHLVKQAGLSIRSLKRIRLGGLHLGGLQEGEYKKVSKDFLEAIFR